MCEVGSIRPTCHLTLFKLILNLHSLFLEKCVFFTLSAVVSSCYCPWSACGDSQFVCMMTPSRQRVTFSVCVAAYMMHESAFLVSDPQAKFNCACNTAHCTVLPSATVSPCCSAFLWRRFYLRAMFFSRRAALCCSSSFSRFTSAFSLWMISISTFLFLYWLPLAA